MKVLKTVLLIFLILVLTFSSYLYFTGPKLPPQTDRIIDSVMLAPIPEMLLGKTGYAQNGDVRIWYEVVTPKTPVRGTILLIMGISNDAFSWPPKFIKAFVDSGYQVIRFDNRGTGMSDWMKKWNSHNAYTLSDMADDGIAVLNAAGIKKAVVLGASMGGMIAQEMAFHHPERVQALVLMMTSGYLDDPELPPVSAKLALKLVRSHIKYNIIGGVKNKIRSHVAGRMILRNNTTYTLDIKEIAELVLYNLKKRNGFNPKVTSQQLVAIKRSGSRYGQLKSLHVPVLVIHGVEDPFIPVEHGKKLAAVVPGADSLWLQNMGHDIPDNMDDTLRNTIIRFVKPNFSKRSSKVLF